MSATCVISFQSDLDVSASEIEDNASSSSQLGHASKEQVYSAFQKAQMRYHKYRGRYTDLANHYKELERENFKMKVKLPVKAILELNFRFFSRFWWRRRTRLSDEWPN